MFLTKIYSEKKIWNTSMSLVLHKIENRAKHPFKPIDLSIYGVKITQKVIYRNFFKYKYVFILTNLKSSKHLQNVGESFIPLSLYYGVIRNTKLNNLLTQLVINITLKKTTLCLAVC